LSIFNRTFERCMGLWASSERLYMSSLYQLWRFENAFAPGQEHNGYDRLYVPQLAWTTGDLDIHDIAVDGAGRPVFVNTLFSCLASVSESHSFMPLWQPPFISKLAAEDRCHLNGLATRGRRAALRDQHQHERRRRWLARSSCGGRGRGRRAKRRGGRCLEAAHLAARGGRAIETLTADDRPHRGVAGEPLGVVDILVAGEPPEYRLPKQPTQLVAHVLSAADHRGAS
jgi:uncharacterized protein (TIGR03032 family)